MLKVVARDRSHLKVFSSGDVINFHLDVMAINIHIMSDNIQKPPLRLKPNYDIPITCDFDNLGCRELIFLVSTSRY